MSKVQVCNPKIRKVSFESEETMDLLVNGVVPPVDKSFHFMSTYFVVLHDQVTFSGSIYISKRGTMLIARYIVVGGSYPMVLVGSMYTPDGSKLDTHGTLPHN